MDVIAIVMVAFAVWFVVSIIELLIDHFSTRCFYVGVFNKIRIMVLVVIIGMIVAYCGVST